MARDESADVLRPSIVDRLTARPVDKPESAYFSGMDVRELKAAVARDLAWLLNTRVWLPYDDADLRGLDEASESILTYGIPDLSTFSWDNALDRRKIASIVEKVIRTFEPRLLGRSVKVEILPTESTADFSVKLRIEAILQVDPISEHVAFDSVAEFGGGGIFIESFE